MEVLVVFGSRDQEIDSWFTNHEPLISILLKNHFLQIVRKLLYSLLCPFSFATKVQFLSSKLYSAFKGQQSSL